MMLKELYLHRFMIANDYISVGQNEIELNFKEHPHFDLNRLKLLPKIEIERKFLLYHINYFLAFDLENKQTNLKDVWLDGFSERQLLGAERV